MELEDTNTKYKIDILSFINGFVKRYFDIRDNGNLKFSMFNPPDDYIRFKSEDLIELFTGGYSYYFAKILEDAFPGGHLCLSYNCDHIVYLYNDKFYDILGEVKNETMKFIPVVYFGDIINDAKQCYYVTHHRREYIKCIKRAKKDGNILTINDTEIKIISR